MRKEFFQQCTNCLTEKQFKALVNVVDFFYDKEEKNYNEKKATYGDMVNQPRDHIFLEFKRLKNYIKNYEQN